MEFVAEGVFPHPLVFYSFFCNGIPFVAAFRANVQAAVFICVGRIALRTARQTAHHHPLEKFSLVIKGSLSDWKTNA
jgi:hypothetical protein